MSPKFSLPVRLGVLVAGTVLPSDPFAGVIVYQHHIEEREAAFARVLQLVRSTRLILDSEVKSMTAGLQVLALSAALQRDDFENFRRNAEAFLSQFPEARRSWSPTARAGRCSTRARRAARPCRCARRTRRPARCSRPGVRPIRRCSQGSISKDLIITITVPVFRNGEVVYDLSFNPSLAEFQRIIERQRPSEALDVLVLRPERRQFRPRAESGKDHRPARVAHAVRRDVQGAGGEGHDGVA